MSLDNLRIWVSPLTNTIYAGYMNKDGKTAKQKIDVTKQVESAIMQYLHMSKQEVECIAGTLKFIPKQD